MLLAQKNKTNAIKGIEMSKKKYKDVNSKKFSNVMNYNPVNAQEYLKSIAACMHSF